MLNQVINFILEENPDIKTLVLTGNPATNTERHINKGTFQEMVNKYDPDIVEIIEGIEGNETGFVQIWV